MGLPLFVAPVESDLPKATRSSKTSSSSPPRSSIRRLAHTNTGRERASLNRRARTIEHHERRRPLPGPGETDVGTSSARANEVARVARYMRMGFTDYSNIERRDADREQRRAELMETMEARFGPGWQNRDWEHPQQDLDSDWWVIQPRIQYDGTGARLVRREFPRQRSRPQYIELLPSSTWPTRRPIGSLLDYGQSTQERSVPRRPLPNDMNGLGDRDRSLSPEGWDTLSATLTPDPQPPSASSSFASTAASHNAGTSTNTSTSGPPAGAGSAPEPPCDSGCEDSDSEENGLSSYIGLGRSAMRTSTLSSGPPRPTEPTFSRSSPFLESGESTTGIPVMRWVTFERSAPLSDILNDQPGSSDPPGTRYSSYSRLPSMRWTRSGEGRASYQRRSPPLTQQRGGEPEGFITETESRNRQGNRIDRLARSIWDEGPSTDSFREDRESIWGLRNSPPPEDDEWAGMQRIMRHLARREQIPDDWWVDVGLGGTISRQPRDQNGGRF